MNVYLKPLDEQVIVITGASSGIGLTTARMAARHGARVVLSARNEDAIGQAADEINDAGVVRHTWPPTWPMRTLCGG